jgi:hypothetical protein
MKRHLLGLTVSASGSVCHICLCRLGGLNDGDRDKLDAITID